MLEIRELTKKYNKSQDYALEDISFSIVKGEMVGLIGKNGAGKTTLIKAISKFIKPTSGNIFLNGKDVFLEDCVHDETGILLEPVFYPQLTAYENLKYYLEINNRTEFINNIKDILKVVGLENSINKKPRDFSFGMKQRLGLSISLLTNPKLLILDEPFVGLDPVGVQDLINILKNWIKTRETMVLISSHQLKELEELCDRFLILESGKLKHDGILSKKKVYTFILDRDYEKDNEKLNKLNTSNVGNEISLVLNDGSITEITNLINENYKIEDITIEDRKFEEYF